ncbi:CDP-alcohol phosphatidyltransferase family protein [Fundidesulfovibrio butyratiphilus]
MTPAPEFGPRQGNWTIPNLLTALRIVFTPVFVVFFLNGRYVLALTVFFVCGLTDALDGFLARVLDQRSRLGAMLDPLADKALLVTSYVCLTHAGWVPLWLGVAVVSRDAVILGGLALLTVSGRDMRGSIRPSVPGKCCTALQMATVLAAFAVRLTGGAGSLLLVLVWLTGLFTAFSGLDYVLRGIRLFFAGTDGPNDRGSAR